MLVGDKMSKPVISISPDMPISDALILMKKEKIRRAPVVKDGKLVGIVSDKDLLNASPSPVTTLSIWEMNYLLSKITVSEVMTSNVLTVTEDTPIEQAARIMADNKIGGLPVMKDGHCVGIITETDLFKVFWNCSAPARAGFALRWSSRTNQVPWQRSPNILPKRKALLSHSASSRVKKKVPVSSHLKLPA